MSNSLLTIVIVAVGVVIQAAALLSAGRARNRALRALLLPMTVLIWGVVATYVVGVWVVEPGLAAWLGKVRLLSVVAASAWGLIRLQRGLDGEEAIHWWGRVIVFAVVIAALLVGLQVLGVNISGVLAFGGFGAIAVGIAGRELFANLFGGRMLFLTQSFREGERINAPKAGVKGVVERIGWYQTTLLTHGEGPMTVPNSFFMSQVVINESRAKFRERMIAVDVKAGQLADAVSAVEPLVASCELLGIEGDVAHLRLIEQTPIYQEQPSRLWVGEQLREALGKAFLSLTYLGIDSPA